MIKRIKVLVVDDSPLDRQLIARLLRGSTQIEVMGMVSDGAEAVQFLSEGSPDVITLDLMMPRMDGFTFLRWLMDHRPVPVLVISTYSESANVFKALELGAADFLEKPAAKSSIEVLKAGQDLIRKIETIATIPVGKLKAKSSLPPVKSMAKPEAFKPALVERDQTKIVEMVVIGASTGGPPAIQTIITQLPANLPATIAVAQHMPPRFTQYFAERLNKISGFAVKEAKAGELVEIGNAYIAPGGRHMFFEMTGTGIRIGLKSGDPTDRYIPSVDTLMGSAAEVFGARVLGVLLTGMGDDGRLGMRRIKDRGGYTIAESEETAVIFGMPAKAIKDGVVDRITPLQGIADEIKRHCLS